MDKVQQVLGYARRENFVVAIGRVIGSCKTLGISINDHFREVTKMISRRTLSIGATPKCLKPMRLCKSQRKHLNLDFSCKLI